MPFGSLAGGGRAARKVRIKRRTGAPPRGPIYTQRNVLRRVGGIDGGEDGAVWAAKWFPAKGGRSE